MQNGINARPIHGRNLFIGERVIWMAFLLSVPCCCFHINAHLCSAFLLRSKNGFRSFFSSSTFYDDIMRVRDDIPAHTSIIIIWTLWIERVFYEFIAYLSPLQQLFSALNSSVLQFKNRGLTGRAWETEIKKRATGIRNKWEILASFPVRVSYCVRDDWAHASYANM